MIIKASAHGILNDWAYTDSESEIENQYDARVNVITLDACIHAAINCQVC